MMHDESLHEKLSALLDGELDAEEQREIEALIASDPAVAREWQALQRVDTLFRTIPRHSAPAELGVRLRPKPAKRPLSFGRPRSVRRAPWPMIAAAAALVLMFGLFVLQLPPSDQFEMAGVDRVAPVEAPPPPALEPEIAADDTISGEWDYFEIVPRAEAEDALAAPPPAPAPPAPPAPPVEPPPHAMLGRSRAAEPPPEIAARAPEAKALDVDDAAAARERTLRRQAPEAESVPMPPLVLPELEQPERRHIGERVFERHGQTWVQDIYEGRETTLLARDSEEMRAFAEEEPALGDMLALEDEVIFEFGGVWYRLPPAGGANEPDSSRSPD